MALHVGLQFRNSFSGVTAECRLRERPVAASLGVLRLQLQIRVQRRDRVGEEAEFEQRLRKQALYVGPGRLQLRRRSKR